MHNLASVSLLSKFRFVIAEELLRINDELNNAFLRYDGYQRLRSNQPNQKLQPTGDFSMPPAYSPSAAPGSQSTPMVITGNLWLFLLRPVLLVFFVFWFIRLCFT